jgi:RHS repeat-associated protein
LTLQAVTDNLSVQVNGTAAITATDSTFLIGDVGLWSYEPASAGQHGFDNFTVVPQGGVSAATINYTYDPLYRLTNAKYSTGTVYTYTYDAVGNRLSQTITATTVYTYDDANRLTNADGVAYMWNANGNLINDGVFTYTYDTVNRLSAVTGGGLTASYAYNGMGARMRQVTGGITTTYMLDLNAGLVQVLADSGANTYLYGNGRIAQFAGATPQYFLADHLGSVRQLTNASGAVTLAKSYQPYGSVLSSAGTGASSYGFTGEVTDSTGLVYLRARYYASGQARFVSSDPSRLERNLYQYAFSNPTRYRDRLGLLADDDIDRGIQLIRTEFPWVAIDREANDRTSTLNLLQYLCGASYWTPYSLDVVLRALRLANQFSPQFISNLSGLSFDIEQNYNVLPDTHTDRDQTIHLRLRSFHNVQGVNVGSSKPAGEGLHVILHEMFHAYAFRRGASVELSFADAAGWTYVVEDPLGYYTQRNYSQLLQSQYIPVGCTEWLQRGLSLEDCIADISDKDQYGLDAYSRGLHGKLPTVIPGLVLDWYVRIYAPIGSSGQYISRNIHEDFAESGAQFIERFLFDRYADAAVAYRYRYSDLTSLPSYLRERRDSWFFFHFQVTRIGPPH